MMFKINDNLVCDENEIFEFIQKQQDFYVCCENLASYRCIANIFERNHIYWVGGAKFDKYIPNFPTYLHYNASLCGKRGDITYVSSQPYNRDRDKIIIIQQRDFDIGI